MSSKKHSKKPLRYRVGTGLLVAGSLSVGLATTGCEKKAKPEDDIKYVNPGPETVHSKDTANDTTAPAGEDSTATPEPGTTKPEEEKVHVNPGPVDREDDIKPKSSE